MGDLHAGHALLRKFACQKADCSMGKKKNALVFFREEHENNEDENPVFFKCLVGVEENGTRGVGQVNQVSRSYLVLSRAWKLERTVLAPIGVCFPNLNE